MTFICKTPPGWYSWSDLDIPQETCSHKSSLPIVKHNHKFHMGRRWCSTSPSMAEGHFVGQSSALTATRQQRNSIRFWNLLKPDMVCFLWLTHIYAKRQHSPCIFVRSTVQINSMVLSSHPISLLQSSKSGLPPSRTRFNNKINVSWIFLDCHKMSPD